MAIKVDRPADYGADGVVVYVAKSIEEVDKAREGFAAAEISVALPQAAIEAMFAAGKSSVPIRVASIDYKRALDVVDELFPPPELILPGDEPEEESAPKLPGDDGSEQDGPARSGPELARVQYDAAAPKKKGPTAEKLQGSLVKLIFITLVSLIMPGLGFVLAGFALYSAWWCFRTLDAVTGGQKAQGRAKIVMGLAGFSLVWNVGTSLYVAWLQGWLS